MKKTTPNKSIPSKYIFTTLLIGFSLSLMAGCGVGLEKGSANRSADSQYPTALVQAENALNEARIQGKDNDCPEEFNELEAMVDKAYEIYSTCRKQPSIEMAEAAILRLNTFCPEMIDNQVYYEPKIIDTPEDPNVIVLAFEDIHFDFDKSILTPESKIILKRNIQKLKDNSESEVRIAGYTSASGSFAYNQALSERRATSVRQYLISEGLIAPNRLTQIGYGEDDPDVYEPAPKEIYSEEAKANMRVLFEIIVR